MQIEEVDKWLAAGEAVRRALSKALDIVREGARLLKIAEELESEIRKEGAQPAFPANISINEVAAHYSPRVEDPSLVPESSIVKVDVGAHVDGCIADAAITVSLDKRHDPLVETAARALQVALAALKPGVKLCSVGQSVELTVKARGFKPIANLTGHLVQRYSLHGGKQVPNVYTESCDKAAAGEVYAVEPFVTNGAGYVVEGEEGAIYRLVSVKSTKTENLDQLLKYLWERYRGLPFSERWIHAEIGEGGLEDLARLVKLRRIYQYPVLIEARGGFVAQFEDTVILTRERIINTTRVLELMKI